MQYILSNLHCSVASISENNSRNYSYIIFCIKYSFILQCNLTFSTMRIKIINVHFYIYLESIQLYVSTVICKKVHKIWSVWCRMALVEVGVSLPWWCYAFVLLAPDYWRLFSKFNIIVSKLKIQNSGSFHTFIESVYFYRA